MAHHCSRKETVSPIVLVMVTAYACSTDWLQLNSSSASVAASRDRDEWQDVLVAFTAHTEHPSVGRCEDTVTVEPGAGLITVWKLPGGLEQRLLAALVQNKTQRKQSQR